MGCTPPGLYVWAHFQIQTANNLLGGEFILLGLPALAGIRNSGIHPSGLPLPPSPGPWSKAILESSQKPFWKIFLDKSGHEMTILISLVKSRRNASRVGPREITGADELQMFFL